MPFNILLIDNEPDNSQFVEWLREEGCEVIEARDRSEAVQRLRTGRLDGVIVNPTLFPNYTCQELVQHICRKASARTAVLILTPVGCLENCRMCSLLRLGMMDCVDTPADSADVVSRLLWLLRHGSPKPARQPEAGLLSPREQEILRLLRSGISNRDIAERLEIAEKVVEKHISHVCRKLDVRNRTEAVALSYRKPLFAPPPRGSL